MISSMSWVQNLDFVALVASDFFEMDVRCDQSRLYKYLSFPDVAFRRVFLANPTFKFATKAQLNDPFDLSRRFDRFGADLLRKFMTKHVAAQLELRLEDSSYLVEEMAKNPKFNASGWSKLQLRQLLEMPIGKAAVAAVRDQMRATLPLMIDAVFDSADSHLDELVEGPIARTGILSLSETPDNRVLWSVYADGGNGFTLEVDAQHPFFLAPRQNGTERNRLMKVSYRDDRIPDIWTNPYYLFAVKHAEYSFEREWRLVRSVDDCDTITISPGNSIYTSAIPKGVITSIIFGHRWSDADIRAEGDILRNFDPHIAVKQTAPNPATGNYSINLVY